MKPEKKVVIYQTKSGSVELRADVEKATIWATQAEMASIFGVNSQAVTKHLKNIYIENELSKKATCSKLEQVRIEGRRKVKRFIEIYNLDAIISVGYRVGSKMGTKFRQWATRVLRSHVVDGYTINKKRLAKNYNAFLHAVEQIRALLPSGGAVGATDALELIKMFANTLGNVFQSFGGKDLYSTVEEKAAHLLYFTVKNHPFIDGNKRSGAFAFVWFLKKVGLLNPLRITPEALTALTLLVAGSDPKNKDRMIGLILLVLK